MISFFTFLGVALILTVEGRWLCAAVAGRWLTKAEMWALGFPLGALLNVIFFFICTVIGIPLLTPVVFFGHLVLLLLLGSCVKKTMQPQEKCEVRNAKCEVNCFRISHFAFRTCSTLRILKILLIISISIKLFYGISESLVPTYYYDSVSQWTMRSKISYEDNAIAFDQDEVRGLSKPQYPILLHSLQIVFMLPQKEWSDAVANGSTLLLTLTSLLLVFLILMRLRGPTTALITVSAILMIPLLSEHLRQGHGDIHVLEYMLLSALLLVMFVKHRAFGLLLLSALVISASAWVKQEGLIFGVLPWIMIVGILMWMNRSNIKQMIICGVLPSIVFGAIWITFLLIKGLPLSPHGGGDTAILWHTEAVSPVITGLFASGSFGIHWYVVLLLIPIMMFTIGKKWKEYVPELSIILWGVIAFFGALFIYICTPNVTYLINGQTFSRTMTLSLVLLVLGVMLMVTRVKK